MSANKKLVSLLEMTERGEVDTSILDGWVGETKVTITAILTNTAVYYVHSGRTDRRFVETLDNIHVEEAKVRILPAREPTSGAKVKAAAAKKTS